MRNSQFSDVKRQMSHVECQTYLTQGPKDQLTNQWGQLVVGSSKFDIRHGTFDI